MEDSGISVFDSASIEHSNAANPLQVLAKATHSQDANPDLLKRALSENGLHLATHHGNSRDSMHRESEQCLLSAVLSLREM